MAKKYTVAKKAIKSVGTKQSVEEFEKFIKKVKEEFENVEIEIIVKSKF